jgi:hypothetical protein
MRDRNQTSTGGAMQASRLLGYVQVHVGSRTVALPVQAIDFATNDDARGPGFVNDRKDAEGNAQAGGLFEEGGQLGILVDGAASDADVQAQIVKASEEAVRRLSKRYLN